MGCECGRGCRAEEPVAGLIKMTAAVTEVAEKVKNAVIPRSEVARSPSFCGYLNQEGSLVRLGGLGMTAFLFFFPRPLKSDRF